MTIALVTPTHNPVWLADSWAKLRTMPGDWQWHIFPNGNVTAAQVRLALPEHPRIHIAPLRTRSTAIGAIKHEAFMRAADAGADVLLELDHDDLLINDAITKVERAFNENEDVGFVYSDAADFGDGVVATYNDPKVRQSWESNGWRFRSLIVEGTERLVPYHWLPSAQALSSIHWAPNHLRAWHADVYRELGGHDASLNVCDDHELLCRTFLETRMLFLPECLYLYRVTGNNSWLERCREIQQKTREIRGAYLRKLVVRDCQIRGLPTYDLGGGLNPSPGFTPVDQNLDGHEGVAADLNERWPFPDNSVGAFRAHDCIEHLRDPQHVMREAYRCLAPGGWFLTHTPSTDGRGAWQDPTHVSFWNENSFWYWTQKQYAHFIRNDSVRFVASRLFTHHPSEWHRQHCIPYVLADLWALKEGSEKYPGERLI